MESQKPITDDLGERPVNQCTTKQPNDDLMNVSEFTVVPDSVKVPQDTVRKSDRVILKCTSEPVTPSMRWNGKPSGLTKLISEPAGLNEGIYRIHKSKVFDNPAFEADDTVPNSPTFADVVRQVMNEPIAEDMHPYGRGHLYATALKLELPTIHQEEGSLFMWFIVTALLLGLVAGIILMSELYEPQVVVNSSLTQTPSSSTTQSQPYNTT